MKKYFYYIVFLICCVISNNIFAQTQTLTIEGDHGKLAAILQTPNRHKNYPLVMLLHGLTGSKDTSLLTLIANKLEANGIASIRFDFNGHGQSEGKFQDMTVLNEINDAQKVYNYVQKLPQVTNISVLGHSQGGVVASMLSGQLGVENIKSVVLMAPASSIKEDVSRGNFFGTTYDINNIPEYLNWRGRRIGKAYLKAFQEIPIYETAQKYTGPVYIIHGTADVIVPYVYGEKYHAVYPNSQLDLLDNVNHNFSRGEALVVNKVVDYFVNILKQRKTTK